MPVKKLGFSSIGADRHPPAVELTLDALRIVDLLSPQQQKPNSQYLGEAAGRALCVQAVEEGCRWYVAQTHPNKEEWAVQHLRQQGFETFFPRFRKREIRRSTYCERLKPVFPGYVFVRFDLATQPWGPIRSTRGVRTLVGPRLGQPQAVPEPVMNYLFRRCRAEVMISLVDALQPGDLVQINTGPLFNRIAKVATLKSSGRVALLFEMLGTTNSIEMDLSSLSPVL